MATKSKDGQAGRQTGQMERKHESSRDSGRSTVKSSTYTQDSKPSKIELAQPPRWGGDKGKK